MQSFLRNRCVIEHRVTVIMHCLSFTGVSLLELASRRAVHRSTLADILIYIFVIQFLSLYMFVL